MILLLNIDDFHNYEKNFIVSVTNKHIYHIDTLQNICYT